MLLAMNVLIYACSYLCLFMIVILDRRQTFFHKHLSWIRRKNHRLFNYSLFQDPDAKYFQSHETLQVPFLIFTALATTLALFIHSSDNVWEIVSLRMGQLTLLNLIFLSLLSSRHSIFLESAMAFQADYLWAHKILGTVTIFEFILFMSFRFRGKSSQFLVGTMN